MHHEHQYPCRGRGKKSKINGRAVKKNKIKQKGWGPGVVVIKREVVTYKNLLYQVASSKRLSYKKVFMLI